MRLNTGFRAVAYYGYRSAHVTNQIVTLDRHCGDGQAFEKRALDNYNWHAPTEMQIGYIDNHTVMQFYNCFTEQTIFVSFSDGDITIGTGIERRSW